MFDFTGTAWDAHEKISAFRPKYITGTVIADQYSSGGSMIDIEVDITSANSDGNIIVTLPVALTYYAGQRIYLTSGIYKGYHKIYHVTTTTVECLTPYTASSSTITFHCVDNNNVLLSWTKLDATAVGSETIEPIIKMSDNSVSIDITAYLQSFFSQIDGPAHYAFGNYNMQSGCLMSFVSGGTALSGMCIYGSVVHTAYYALVNTVSTWDIPMVDAHVIFLNYRCTLPFLKETGIYDLHDSGLALQSYLNAHSLNPGNFIYSNFCNKNAINIFFINKYGGWQNFVSMGSYTEGREIADPKTIMTAYPMKKRISDPGKIFKTLKNNSSTIARSLIPIVTAMVESPITFIYDQANSVYIECFIDKKSYDYREIGEDGAFISFDLIVSETIYTQLR